MLSVTLREGIASAVQSIASTYNADVASIERDLHTFLADLETKRLVFHSERPLSSPQPRARLAALLLPPLFRCIHSWPTSLKMKVWVLLTLAYLSIRLFDWPTTVIVWQRCLRSTVSYPNPSIGDVSMEMIEDTVRTAISRYPCQIACKERALCCWYLLRSARFPAKLVVGVNLFPLGSHCWCEFGPTPFCDEKDKCQQFTPVLSYE